MSRLHHDLALLAVVGQVYGCADGAQNLYSLAQLSCQSGPILDALDVEIGLSLIGIQSVRLLAPNMRIPSMIPFALGHGHMVLAQLKKRSDLRYGYWVALTSVDNEGWAGIMVGWDFLEHGISDRLGWELAGYYVIVHGPIPGWELEA